MKFNTCPGLYFENLSLHTNSKIDSETGKVNTERKKCVATDGCLLRVRPLLRRWYTTLGMVYIRDTDYN